MILNKIYISPDYFLLKILVLVFSFKTKKINTKHGPIVYYEYESKAAAPTIVLVHGIGVSAVHFYQLLVRFRLKGYRVLGLDLPSHGNSPDLDIPLTADALYIALAEWMDKVAPQKFILVGNSLGGGLSLKYAFAQPHRVSHLIVNSPVGGFEEEADWELVRKKIILNTLEETADFLKMIYHSPPFYLPLMVRFFHANMQRTGIVHLISTAKVEDFLIKGKKSKDFPPVLFVWGKSERLFTQKSLNWFKQNMIPSVEFDEPERLGHCAHMECPVWFTHRIEQFVQKFL